MSDEIAVKRRDAGHPLLHLGAKLAEDPFTTRPMSEDIALVVSQKWLRSVGTANSSVTRPGAQSQ
jgi:hypothetical protein